MKSEKSLYIIVAISLFVGLLHFLVGPNYDGMFKIFIRGYLIDIMLPMNMYLLLQLFLRKNMTIYRSRLFGAAFTFAFGVMVEVSQYYDIDLFGSTFDPIDILMYAIGIGIGFSIDLTILSHFEDSKNRN